MLTKKLILSATPEVFQTIDPDSLTTKCYPAMRLKRRRNPVVILADGSDPVPLTYARSLWQASVWVRRMKARARKPTAEARPR